MIDRAETGPRIRRIVTHDRTAHPRGQVANGDTLAAPNRERPKTFLTPMPAPYGTPNTWGSDFLQCPGVHWEIDRRAPVFTMRDKLLAKM